MKTLEENKAIVSRFNKEFIEEGNEEVFDQIVDEHFVFHEHLHAGTEGREAYRNFFHRLMKLPNSHIKVTIDDFVAEGDRVVIQKINTITAKVIGDEKGDSFVTEINAIEIIHLKDEKYIECWNLIDSEDVGMNVILEELSVF